MKFIVSANNFFAGLQYDITEAGHEWYWWTDNKPTFDIFDEVQPDVIMVTELTPSILKCIIDKTIVIVWNENTNMLTVNEKEFVVGPRVDTNAFQPTKPSSDFRCDLARVGTVDNILRRICYPVGRFNIKIFGDDNGGGYGVAQYLGRITHEEECKVYSSAIVTYVDDINSALKVLRCGGCPVSSNKDIKDFAEIVQDYDELYDLLDTWTNNEVLINVVLEQYRPILDNMEYTYTHLAIVLLETINDIADN